MKEIIISLTQKLQDHFNGKTVGQAGADFGATLTNGPFTITTYFHQWEDIENPSVHLQVIGERPAGYNFECCGGVTSLQFDIRISVDQKGQSWSIAHALYEELRTWFCEINYSIAPDTEDYLVIIDQDKISANFMYEGDIYSIHTLINCTYLRGYVA